MDKQLKTPAGWKVVGYINQHDVLMYPDELAHTNLQTNRMRPVYAEDDEAAALQQEAQAQPDTTACKRCNSYATLVKSLEDQLAHHRAKAKQYAEAVATLESERAANALLTEQLEVAQAQSAPTPAAPVPVALDERETAWNEAGRRIRAEDEGTYGLGRHIAPTLPAARLNALSDEMGEEL